MIFRNEKIQQPSLLIVVGWDREVGWKSRMEMGEEMSSASDVYGESFN